MTPDQHAYFILILAGFAGFILAIAVASIANRIDESRKARRDKAYPAS